MKQIFYSAIQKANNFLTLSSLLLLAANGLLSCDNELPEEGQNKTKSPLTISVETNNWGGGTRATYSTLSENSGNKDFAMSFQSGDAVGVFICDKTGKVIVANKKYTYSGSAWASEVPTEYVTGMGSFTFFAYYPWVASLSGAPALNSTPDVSSADNFFASAIAAWTPAANQSTLAAYTGSDLMVAKGTTNMPYFHEVEVAFTLAHKMGLVVTQPDLTFYDINDPSYTWTVTQTFTGNVPYQIGSNYYYLVKPGVETTVGAKATTLASGEMEQLYFTNMEPGEVERSGDMMTLHMGRIKLGSSPTYSYKQYHYGQTSPFSTSQPSWLTITPNVVDGNIDELTITVTNSTSTTYSKGTGNVRDVPGDAVLKAASPVSNVDLSMVDNAGNARASRTTANCYLVHAPGTYKIPLVYGNAIKNGDETSTAAFYTTQTSYTLQRLVNHANAGITSPWIKTQLGSCPDGAQLVWEDVQGMISSVGIDTSDNGYLTFTVDADNIAEGNAVIAATLDGVIVWSWHVWVTPQTLSNLTTVDTGSHVYQVAPVNVGHVEGLFMSGATIYAGDLCTVTCTSNGVGVEFTVTAKDYTSGGTTRYNPSPYYQWGRKDAMYPCTGGYNSEGTLVNSYTQKTKLNGENIAISIQHPDYWSASVGVYALTAYRNYWNMNQTGTDDIATATVKTVYDPCPPGFCVPTSNLYYYANSNSGNTTWQDTPPGRTWTVNGNPIFFPATSIRVGETGALANVGLDGYAWSTAQKSYYSDNAYFLYFYTAAWAIYYDKKYYGMPVRPASEE